MTEARTSPPDFTALYKAYNEADTGTKALIRRAASLDHLLNEPAFYRLIGKKECGYAAGEDPKQWARLVFCLPHVRHSDEGMSLGAALAQSGKIKDRRIFQVIRAESPQDIVQLRRLLQFCEPTLDWRSTGATLWYWGPEAKRRLLENFVLGAPDDDKPAAKQDAKTSKN